MSTEIGLDSNSGNPFQGFSQISEETVKIDPQVQDLINSIKKKEEEEKEKKFEKEQNLDKVWNQTSNFPYGKQPNTIQQGKSPTVSKKSLKELLFERDNSDDNSKLGTKVLFEKAENEFDNFDIKKTDPSYKNFKKLQNKHLWKKIALIFFTIVIPSIIFALSFLAGGAGLATLFTLQLYAIIPPLAAKIAIIVAPIIVGALGTFGLSFLNNCLIKKFSSQKNSYSTIQLLLLTITSLGVGLTTGGLGGGLLYTLVLTKPVLDIAALIVSVAAPLLFGTTTFGILSAVKITFAVNWANEEHALKNAAAKNKIKEDKESLKNKRGSTSLNHYFKEREIKNKINFLRKNPNELDPTVHKLLFERDAYIPPRMRKLRVCKEYLKNEIKNKKYWPKIISIIFTVGAIIASAVLFGFLGYGVLLVYPAVLTLKATILAILLSSSIGGVGAGALSSLILSIFLVNKKVVKRIPNICGYRETLNVGKQSVNLGEKLKEVDKELKDLEKRKEILLSYEKIFTEKITKKNSDQRFNYYYKISKYYKAYENFQQQQKLWGTKKEENSEDPSLEIETNTSTQKVNPPKKKVSDIVISDEEQIAAYILNGFQKKEFNPDLLKKLQEKKKSEDDEFGKAFGNMEKKGLLDTKDTQKNEIEQKTNPISSKNEEFDDILSNINNDKEEGEEEGENDDNPFPNITGIIKDLLPNSDNLDNSNLITTPIDYDQIFSNNQIFNSSPDDKDENSSDNVNNDDDEEEDKNAEDFFNSLIGNYESVDDDE